jgi:hypothetical protein
MGSKTSRDYHLYPHFSAKSHSIDDPPFERTHFKQTLPTAANSKNWWNLTFPVWLPAYLNGKLVVGGVTGSHLACHPIEGFLGVGFWAAGATGGRGGLPMTRSTWTGIGYGY